MTEQTGAQPERILCCNVLNTEKTHRDSIFRHPLFAFEEASAWPPENWKDLCCWHCCHKCPHEPVCLPNSYDRRRDVFHVFGLFCSLACAKAHLMEHAAFGAGDRVLLLHYMAMRFFGHKGGPVAPAPPRHRLQMFGGDLAIEAFRKEHEYLSTTISPPLITTPEVYERCATPASDSWACKGSSRGGQPSNAPAASTATAAAEAGSSAGLFTTFLRQKRAAASTAALAAGCSEANSQEGVPGTLSVFMKKKRT